MFEDIDHQLGRRLRRRRHLLSLTQQELAAIVGLRFQQIHRYESAANRMSAAVLGRLAQALGVGVGYFFEGLESRRRAPQSPGGRSVLSGGRDGEDGFDRCDDVPDRKDAAAIDGSRSGG